MASEEMGRIQLLQGTLDLMVLRTLAMSALVERLLREEST